MNDDDAYLCIGICMADPDSGYCLGCGRPPISSPEVVAELATPAAGLTAQSNDPDSPP
jgi:hypothetical protein